MSVIPSTPNTLACEAAITILSTPHIALQLQTCATLEELHQLWELDRVAYGDCSLEFDEFSQWWQRYEFGSRNLVSEGQIQASIGVYPLYEDQALDFISGQLQEGELQPVTVTECEIEPQQYWYASGIVVRPDLRGWNSPLRTLLQSGLSSWLDSGHVAYPLTILAIGEYEIGKRLLEFLGFCKIRDGSQMPDGYDIYQAQFSSRKEAATLLKQRMR